MIPLLTFGILRLLELLPLIKVQLKNMLDQGTAHLGFLKRFSVVELPIQVWHQHGHGLGRKQVDHHQLELFGGSFQL